MHRFPRLVTDIAHARNRAAPYPPPTPGPISNALESHLHIQTTADAPSHNTEGFIDHPADRSDVIRPKTSPDLAHLTNRTVVSESGVMYTLLPYTAAAQDHHHGPAIADVELCEDAPSSTELAAAKRVRFVDEQPSAVQDEVSTPEDSDANEKMAVLVKKFIEYVKKTEGGSESGEEERE